MADGPDWTIDFSAMPRTLTSRQKLLLDEIEDALPQGSAVRNVRDPAVVMEKISPLVWALHESGLSATEIADNSRLRPQAVDMLLNQGGAHPEVG